jgi:rhodanese-related sulfurtransferase
MDQQCEWDVSVEDLKRLRDERADFVLLDVREEHEYEACNLEGQLIPLGALNDRLGELDPSAHIVVHCKSGGRSAHAVKAMREAGFENVWNVHGGMLAWIARIDNSLSLDG